MVTIHLLSIEPFEERYTAQWHQWWFDELAEQGWEVNRIDGRTDYTERKGGEFLDPISTWAWKGEQVANLAAQCINGTVKDGDILLIMDGWGIAVPAAAYIRDVAGLRVKIAAFWHAGSYDKHDLLGRTIRNRWGLEYESGLIEACDMVLVGSNFHADMIRNELDTSPNIVVCGNPIHAAEIRKIAEPEVWKLRDDVVCFPHRLAPEKAPEGFRRIQEIYEEAYGVGPSWLMARELCQTKAGYYKLLGSSKVVVSTAYQETFGIAMQEGIACGAWAVAPHRLSYPETIGPGGGLYRNFGEAAQMINRYLNESQPAPWQGDHEDAVLRASNALQLLT